MNFRKKHISSKIILWVFVSVITFTIAELFYFNYKSENIEKLIIQKQKAVSIIGLPDLALATEAVWLRHRSIGNVFSIFPEDGSLLDYYPASFVYKTGTLSNKPSLNQKQQR